MTITNSTNDYAEVAAWFADEAAAADEAALADWVAWVAEVDAKAARRMRRQSATRNSRILADMRQMLADLDDIPQVIDCCTTESQYACAVCVERTAFAMDLR